MSLMKLLYLFTFKFYVRCVKFILNSHKLCFQKYMQVTEVAFYLIQALLCMTAFWVLIPLYTQYYGKYFISFKFKYMGVKIVLKCNYSSKSILSPDVPNCKVLCIYLHPHACMCMYTHTCASQSFTLYLNQCALKIGFQKLTSSSLLI